MFNELRVCYKKSYVVGNVATCLNRSILNQGEQRPACDTGREGRVLFGRASGTWSSSAFQDKKLHQIAQSLRRPLNEQWMNHNETVLDYLVEQ